MMPARRLPTVHQWTPRQVCQLQPQTSAEFQQRKGDQATVKGLPMVQRRKKAETGWATEEQEALPMEGPEALA